MARRRRRLGHITEVESSKVDQALWMARNTCDRQKGDKKEGCFLALNVLKDELKYAGFKLM